MIHKLKYMWGRHYGGYLTPTEIIMIAANKDTTCNKNDLLRAYESQRRGDSRPTWFYFDVDQNSKFETKLLREVQKK